VVQNTSFDQSGIQIGESKVGLLAYVDDLVMLAENKEKLIGQTLELLEVTKRMLKKTIHDSAEDDFAEE